MLNKVPKLCLLDEVLSQYVLVLSLFKPERLKQVMIFSFVTRQTIYRFATCIFLYNGQAHYFSLCMQILAQACQTSSIQRFREQHFTENSSIRFSVTLLASQIAYLAFLKAIMSNNPLSQRQNNNFLFQNG